MFDRRRVCGEAIGTFFLVLIGPGAAMVNAWSGGAGPRWGVPRASALSSRPGVCAWASLRARTSIRP